MSAIMNVQNCRNSKNTGHSPKRVKFLEKFKTFLYKTWKESRNAIFKSKISNRQYIQILAQ